MTKVLKVYLICNAVDKNGNVVDYTSVNRILWDLQKETRMVKNKAVQLCWEWFNFESAYLDQHGVYPKEKDILQLTLAGYVYQQLSKTNHLQTGNLSRTLHDVCKDFKYHTKEFRNGMKAIINYKHDQPLDLNSRYVDLQYVDTKFKVTISLLNLVGMQHYNMNRFDFDMIVKDKSTRCILERCYDGVYKIVTSHLVYDKDKKLWRLHLCYDCDIMYNNQLDKNIILGVDLGVAKPLVASVYGDKNRFVVRGNEILAFNAKIEQRKKALQKQSCYCGNGRIGHGTKKRIKPSSDLGNKVARFRETTNFKYAKALVEYAVKNHCGTIQMEDLTGIAVGDAFLSQWSYFDLQEKITNKAAEYGIDVIKINPEFTSQRCSQCGFIHKNNRPTQREFKCLNCGFKEDADYNASQNISIKDIDKIIEDAQVIST